MATSSRRRLVTIALVFCGLHTGCSMLQPQASPKLTAEVAPAAGQAAATAGGNTYTVEVRKADGRTSLNQQELTGSLHVQEALVKTKANKQFRRFKLALNRPLPDGRIHNMQMEYDRVAKQVEPEYDYAILPGDRLIVTEDTTNMLDEAMDAISAPFGGSAAITGKPRTSGKYRTGG